MPLPLQDRLKLTKGRIEAMAEGLRQLVELEDPVGRSFGHEETSQWSSDRSKEGALGVIGIIYEARPNVGRCLWPLFKTGNVVILKGGSDALHSNQAIVHTALH